MNINNIEELGKLIKNTRKAQKLTQKDLALVAGMSVRLIVELENGKRGVSIESIIKLCSLLGMKIDIEQAKNE